MRLRSYELASASRFGFCEKFVSRDFRLLQHNRHIADNQVAPAFVRFRTTADKGGFWPEMGCPLLTHVGHRGRISGAVRYIRSAKDIALRASIDLNQCSHQTLGDDALALIFTPTVA